MRSATRSQIRLANRPCEVRATIHLPKGKRINVDKALVSFLGDLKGGAEHVDAVFIRVVRETK